ncbi:MAG: sugar phosphate isomerase/epimerase [Planctomycetota bacterium]|nr:MAG: sugar phosphate isomerase/epimerase [Planctomycetota bacterium]
MRLSSSTRCLADWPLLKSLTAVSETGYQAVELSWSRIESEFSKIQSRAPLLRAILDEHELDLSGMNTSGLTVTNHNELTKNITDVHEQMKFARTMRLTGVNLKGGNRRQQSFETLIHGLKALIPLAEELDITINLANQYNSRIEQPEDLHNIFQQLNHPCLRVLNDTGQFHLASVNPRDALREFGDRTEEIRIADMIGDTPTPPGEGEINVPAIIEHARRLGYKGWLVADTDTLTNQRRTLGYLQKLL